MRATVLGRREQYVRHACAILDKRCQTCTRAKLSDTIKIRYRHSTLRSSAYRSIIGDAGKVSRLGSHSVRDTYSPREPSHSTIRTFQPVSTRTLSGALMVFNHFSIAAHVHGTYNVPSPRYIECRRQSIVSYT